MATVKVQATFCEGGGHAHVTLTVSGAAQWTETYTLDDIVGTPTKEEQMDWVKNFVRLHKIGKTTAQVKSDLIAGITVTV